MALLTNSIITREALRVFHQNATFLKKIDRRYKDQFAKSGAKVGDTISIRKQSRGKIRRGRVMDTNVPSDDSVKLTIQEPSGVDLSFSMADKTLNIDDFRVRYLESPIATLVANIEADVIKIAIESVYNQVGNPNTVLDLAKALRAKMVLQNNHAPIKGRYFLANTAGAVQVVESSQTFFNSQSEIKNQYEEGIMGRAAGFDWFENTNAGIFTNGSGAGYTVSAVSGDGKTLTLAGGNGKITLGTVFNIAGVYAINMDTKQNTGLLQDFVALEDLDAPGTLKISPALNATASSPYQNVDAAPAPNAAVTIKGAPNESFGVNLAFHRDFMTFVTVDMELPTGGVDASRYEFDGISMTHKSQYNIVNDMQHNRFDVMWGAAVTNPELAVRVANNVTLI